MRGEAVMGKRVSLLYRRLGQSEKPRLGAEPLTAFRSSPFGAKETHAAERARLVFSGQIL